MGKVSSTAKFFYEDITAVDISSNIFDVDGHILLLGLLNVVLTKVDNFETFICSNFRPVHAGVVVIVVGYCWLLRVCYL